MNCEGWSSGETKLGWAYRAIDGGGVGLARSSNEVGFGYATVDGEVGLSRVGVGSGVKVWAAVSRSRLSLSFFLHFRLFRLVLVWSLQL